MTQEIRIDFSEHDKQVLTRVGNGAYGRELVKILERAKEQVCSLESVDRTRDTGAQVEGRLLFKDFAVALIERLTYEKGTKQKQEDLADGML